MNRRKGKRASNDVLAYFLDKYREQLHKQENQRRKELKEKHNGA